jgi:D-3-phosphoglycerate dehydrogenase / 2-oxoglutarate reductase
MKILLLDSAHPSLSDNLRKNGFTCEEDFTSSKEEIENKILFYNGVVLRSRITIDKQFINAFAASDKGKSKENLFIARIGAGMEHIDVAYAESKGIKCISSPEGNRNAVAEHALGMLLNLMNSISKADAEVKAGHWLREANRGTELEGKTIGIYGFGNTGSAFAKILGGFDVTILVYDKYKHAGPALAIAGSKSNVSAATPEKIANEADIVSLHLPLTEETKYLVNDSFLSRFRKNIFLINTSRGPIVNTDDLVRNLQSGKVRGACLDVLEYEENSFELIQTGAIEQKPAALQYLLNSRNVILTPHIAGWSFESAGKMAGILVDKIYALTSK